MCGRFDRHSRLIEFSEIIDHLNVADSEEISPSFNIAPSQQSLIVCDSNKGPVATPMLWGFRPHWLETMKTTPPINARSETVHRKPMFQQAFRRQRCLILCNGYFEWQNKTPSPKQAHYIFTPEQMPFVMAGLWDRNVSLDGQQITSFAILTTKSHRSIAHVHDRMPIRLQKDVHTRWLDSTVNDVSALLHCLKSSHHRWESYPVSSYVNNPRNNSAQCIIPDNTDG